MKEKPTDWFADDEGDDGNISGLEALEAGTRINGEALDFYRYPQSKRIHRSGNPYPRELHKVLVGALFMMLSFFVTTLSISITHERVPQYKALPDIIFDLVRYQHSALMASEVLLSIQCTTTILICIFHKHRYLKDQLDIIIHKKS